MGPWGRSITRHPGINYRGNNRSSAAIRADFAEKGGRGPTTFCPYGDEWGATTVLVEVLEPSTAVSADLSLPEIGFGIGIAHGFVTLGTIGCEGRFDYAAIGTVSNVASRLCDEAKPGQILISARVLMKVENAVKVEPVGEFVLKGYGGHWRRTMWSPPCRLRCEAIGFFRDKSNCDELFGKLGAKVSNRACRTERFWQSEPERQHSKRQNQNCSCHYEKIVVCF
jgi:hypothetical protein